MPVTIKKVKRGKKSLWTVRTPGGVKARGTTKARAEAQGRLLRAVEHGWTPTRARRRVRKAIFGK